MCQAVAEIANSDLNIINCHSLTESSDFLGEIVPTASQSAKFEWKDGILVESMKNGKMLLIDEISLASDAIIERLNSVLEAEKYIVLSENLNLSSESSKIESHENFRIFATMNPSGDFGKKEVIILNFILSDFFAISCIFLFLFLVIVEL